MLGALIFSGLVIIFLLVVGQILYRKYPKTAYWIWGLTILISAYLLYSFNTKNISSGDKDLEKYVGNYEIDLYNSNYDGVNLQDYYDLLLTVNKNKTFKFSKETPFFDTSFGHWQHIDDGDINWTEISIGNNKLAEAEVETDKWRFNANNLKSSKSGNFIIFKRK